MAAKQIPLQDWAERHFDPPPSIRTLRRWARQGRIAPAPELVGREYRVREDAAYVPPQRPLRVQPVVVLESEDPVVNDIIASGKTKERRQA
ncbi:MAG TPA: excisionase [Gammaproteobacteria bacterium]|nr:excisionase [Gammaproteobacteria bacterium]